MAKVKEILYFGEKIKGYDVRVLNEREVRAGAGILFALAMIAFLNAWLIGNFYVIKIFVIGFLIDFSIRIFINPKFSPSLILGRLVVRNQKPEYVGAPQKKFAWSLGLVLAATMFFLVVLNGIIGPINLFICLTCLTLLFFETSFGICIGCELYNLFSKEKARYCPGGVCEIMKREEIQKVGTVQILILLLFILSIISIHHFGALNPSSLAIGENPPGQGTGDILDINESAEECKVPDWAVEIGHEDMYRLHHGCT